LGAVCVSWNGVFSGYLLVHNGVKQDGVLNPVLFCVYIDSLLLKLTKAGVGCFIDADDIVLVALDSLVKFIYLFIVIYLIIYSTLYE